MSPVNVKTDTLPASAVTALRLHNQHIARSAFETPAQLLGWLGGIQGQDYHGAKWSLGLRLPGSTDSDMEQAIATGAIVRTWPMRGTLHFVAAADVHWLLALTAPRNIAGHARRHRELHLDERVFGRSAEVFAKALQGGRQLTRDELYAQLQAAGISAEGQRGYHLLWRAASDRLICCGPPRGKQHTFVLLDEWVAPADRFTPDEPRAELARRYFTSRGPATWKDYLWWSGLAAADARDGFEAIQPGLVQTRVAGKDYWMAAGLTDIEMTAKAAAPRAAYALPGFDEYLLGYQDRSVVLDAQHAVKVCPGGNGMFAATLIVNGRVAGVWSRTTRKDLITLSPQPFAALGTMQKRLLAQAAKRYSAFLGKTVEIG